MRGSYVTPFIFGRWSWEKARWITRRRWMDIAQGMLRATTRLQAQRVADRHGIALREARHVTLVLCHYSRQDGESLFLSTLRAQRRSALQGLKRAFFVTT